MKASDYFQGKEGYNCAQAILKSFQEHLSVSEDDIKRFKKFGGGRAEHGYCGALYAAHYLLKDPEKIKLLNEMFSKEAGALKCREIRKAKKLSCAGCVDVAAEALSRISLK